MCVCVISSELCVFNLRLTLQMTKVSKDHCLEIINKFEPCSENQKQGVLGIDGGFFFLTLIELKLYYFHFQFRFFGHVSDFSRFRSQVLQITCAAQPGTSSTRSSTP